MYEQNRTIKELFIIMLDNQFLYKNPKPEGMCAWAMRLYAYDIITIEEYIILTEYIAENKPITFYRAIGFFARMFCVWLNYYWKPGNINPRIKWIKKQIKNNN